MTYQTLSGLLSELRDRGDLVRILHRSAVKVITASLFYEPRSTMLVVSLQLKGLCIISIRFNGEEGSHWELKTIQKKMLIVCTSDELLQLCITLSLLCLNQVTIVGNVGQDSKEAGGLGCVQSCLSILFAF